MKASYNRQGQMVAEKWYNAADQLIAHYKYVYDGKGNIGRSIDLTAGKEYNYTYENDALVRAAEFTITVNGEGLVTEKVPADTVTYTYNTDGKLVKKRILPADGAERLIYYEASDAEETIVRINTGERTVLFHGKTDSFGRKTFDEMQLGGKGYLSRQFSYHEGVITQEHEEKEKLKSSPTTQLVSRITFANGRTLSYEYDEEERITKVIDSLGETTEYTYDALGQLWTEKVNGVVVNDMEYDNYGNITKKNGIRYTYGDGQWKDLLTGYGSQTIAYDAQGNPTSYLGHTLTWEKGRQLKTYDNNTYTYNANGIRTGKTVNGVTHTYQLEGSGILRESWKENGHTYELIPLYDNENSVCGIIYENATYYFQKNLQGDVIALVDANAQVVARYTYDAWGSVTGVKTKDGAAITDTAHIAHVNPFRYRGYYLDRETGLYYLQSRYYDPVVGRFVNGDMAEFATVSHAILIHNLFVYCGNNSVMQEDRFGYLTYSYDALKQRSWLFKVAKYFGINFELKSFEDNATAYILRINLYAVYIHLSISVGLAINFSGAFSTTFGADLDSISASFNLGIGSNYALAYTYTLSWYGLSKSVSLVWCSGNDGVFVSLNAHFYISHACAVAVLATALAFSPQFAPALATVYVNSKAAITTMMLALAQITKMLYAY